MSEEEKKPEPEPEVHVLVAVVPEEMFSRPAAEPPRSPWPAIADDDPTAHCTAPGRARWEEHRRRELARMRAKERRARKRTGRK